MANNSYVNKVEFGNTTVMDITDTTAETEDVLDGKVFYAKSGARSVGTLGDATQSTHGLMSASDKIKLDGITLLGVNLNSNALTPDANGYVNIPVMTGATSSTAGTGGLVPAPSAGDQGKALFGDGSWKTVNTNVYGNTIDMSSTDSTKISDAIDAVDAKIPFVQEPVSGDIATLTDVGGMSLELTVGIEPVQDLHGYDKPWVGGAGKNLLELSSSYDDLRGVTYTPNPETGVLTLGGSVPNADCNRQIGGITVAEGEKYFISGTPENGGANTSCIRYIFRVAEGGSAVGSAIDVAYGGIVVTVPETATYLGLYVHTKIDSNPNGYVLKPFVARSDVALPFEPYSNICPISGFTEENIIVNLLDYRKIFSEGETLKSNVLTYKMTVPNGTYTLSTNIPLDGTLRSCFFTNKDESAQSAVNGVYYNHPRTITVTDGEVWIHVRTGNPSGGYIITEDLLQNGTYWICLREGTTAPIYTITFPSEAGTVYGGTLTINQDGSGQLVSNRYYAKVKDLSVYSVVNSKRAVFTLPYSSPGVNKADNGLIGNSIATGNYSTDDGDYAFMPTTARITINLTKEVGSNSSDWDTWKASCGYEFSYIMIGATSYQLAAEQIRTILGYNRIYANTGSIISAQSGIDMAGATATSNGTHGFVPAPSAGDENKFLAGDGTYKSGGLPMVILSYGSSTWAEFEAAYNNNVIVYCRASSNSNPASGSQTRMAFMAYVNNATTPTEVEFQYYRSMSTHSATAMGD
jgi:hypothetical protein